MWCDLLQEVWGCQELRQSGAGQVDGEATVVTGALEAVVFLLFLGELCHLLQCLGWSDWPWGNQMM